MRFCLLLIVFVSFLLAEHDLEHFLRQKNAVLELKAGFINKQDCKDELREQFSHKGNEVYIRACDLSKPLLLLLSHVNYGNHLANYLQNDAIMAFVHIKPDIKAGDLTELINSLKTRFNKQKVGLAARALASIFAQHYAHEYPQNLLFYIGSSQLVDMRGDERLFYEAVLNKLAAKKDPEGELGADYHKLLELSSYPYIDDYDKLISTFIYLRKLRANENTCFKHSALWVEQNMKTLAGFLDQYLEFNLDEDRNYSLPIYYLLSENDCQVLPENAVKYFYRLRAAKKELYLLPSSLDEASSLPITAGVMRDLIQRSQDE